MKLYADRMQRLFSTSRRPLSATDDGFATPAQERSDQGAYSEQHALLVRLQLQRSTSPGWLQDCMCIWRLGWFVLLERGWAFNPALSRA